MTDGQPARFSVAASGNQPLTYQWKQGSTPVPGASTATLSIPTTIYSYHNGATYSVVVTDAAGSQLASQSATLTINPKPPTITESPLSATVVPDSTATFAVAAYGSLPLTYQWNRNGVAIAGATTRSYTTGPNTRAQNNLDAYTVTITNGAKQTTTSAPALLTVAAGSLAPSIVVDCTEEDAAVAHQVTYRRGVVEGFDIGRAHRPPSTIVGNVKNDIQTSGVNFLNATLDINSSEDTPFFAYTAPNLTPSTSGSAPLVQTFNLLRSDATSSALPAAVQISGTPAAYPSSNLDSGYERPCPPKGPQPVGNFYPLPSPGTMMQVAQNAVESWMGDLNSSFPGAIWIGTQEPSHTLGFSTTYDNNGCADVSAADVSKAVSTNIQRFISYWTPIAQYLRANHMLSGGIQLNSGNSDFYDFAAKQIISEPMPLDYFTIQNYSPSPTITQSIYNAYQEFQQHPDYLDVKVIIDRYGLSLGQNEYTTAAGMIQFLQREAELMPYADMMYGYAVATIGIEGAPNAGPTILPPVLKWLQAAPAPLRPLTSTTSDLQAFALVQKNASRRAYVAIWNASTTVSYTTALVLKGFSPDVTASSLTILKGSGTSITSLDQSGITVSGYTIGGLSLNGGEFLLISLQ
ncbi:immunoglobulin domain-containing protein [Pendulispora brunnea]|uniref:Immunoglobulin domain-containing protein n=1 Tax=Pendulispora brunnea TaxID=2905690 RepID=A0ABZ2K4U5_9BACT